VQARSSERKFAALYLFVIFLCCVLAYGAKNQFRLKRLPTLTFSVTPDSVIRVTVLERHHVFANLLKPSRLQDYQGGREEKSNGVETAK
jgi:hypothetical protein